MKQIVLAAMLSTAGIVQIAAQNIEIKGVVTESAKKDALEFANVVLQTADSAFVTGAVSGRDGGFTLGQVAAGDYRIVVSSVGYETQFIELEGLNRDMRLDVALDEAAVSLDNVTVTGSNISSRIDRKIVVPTGRHIKASSNGIDLLQQLMLPRVVVNPLFGEVSISGGGELQLRINGVKVEREDILALQPADVVRIEYHDNPGLRYGNAEIVLDFIVHRPETGGDIGLNLSDAVNVAWGNNFINGRINRRKSEFAVNYGISHRDFYQMWRDNEETFTFADGSTLQRREKGEPGHGEVYWQNLNAKYNYQDDRKIFNATFRLYAANQLHWDYHGILYNVKDETDAVDMIDRTSGSGRRPALDLYYQHNLPAGQTIVLNAVGTYNGTTNSRTYRESRGDALLTDVRNSVDGRKYSFIGEGIYEKKFGEKRLSAGVRHSQSTSDNTYINGHNYTTEMAQAETFLYSELKGTLRKLDYTLGTGVTRSRFEQAGESSYENYTFNPRVVLFLPLPANSSVRLQSEISNASPSLSNLSAIEQVIDSLQIQRGNPNLNPHLRYKTQLSYERKQGIVYVRLQGLHEYHPNAIMEEKRLEGGKIIQTWDNQKSWQKLGGEINLRVGPVKDMLEFSITSQINHHISHGNEYLHKYTNWYNSAEANFTYRRFIASLIFETAWDRFYGETMEGGENIHIVMTGYRHKNLSVILGMFNPFVDNYRQRSENRSRYASYKRSNYINETSRMVILRLTYNFSFGRTFSASQKRLNNTDDDSGVMSTGK
jgi:hypothetical protein